jgi:hypothetical protein
MVDSQNDSVQLCFGLRTDTLSSSIHKLQLKFSQPFCTVLMDVSWAECNEHNYIKILLAYFLKVLIPLIPALGYIHKKKNKCSNMKRLISTSQTKIYLPVDNQSHAARQHLECNPLGSDWPDAPEQWEASTCSLHP